MDDADWDKISNDPYERVLAYKLALTEYFTGGSFDGIDYAEMRKDLLTDPSCSDLVPKFIRRCRDTSTLWTFAKSVDPQWAPRREFLNDEFEPLLDKLETLARASPAINLVTEGLSKLDEAQVRRLWDKALSRCTTDPEGAITAARALLETTCKLLLDELSGAGAYDDRDDLPKLYRTVSDRLNLSASQHTEDVFKRILGGCTSVVEGLGTLRNRIGDAHGYGKRAVRPQPRHAFLAVNLSGAMAFYLVETWLARASDVASG